MSTVHVKCTIQPRHGTGSIKPNGKLWLCAEKKPLNVSMESQYRFSVEGLSVPEVNTFEGGAKRYLSQQITLAWRIKLSPPWPPRIITQYMYWDELFELRLISRTSATAQAMDPDNHGLVSSCADAHSCAVMCRCHAILQFCSAKPTKANSSVRRAYALRSFHAYAVDEEGSMVGKPVAHGETINSGLSPYHQDYETFPLGPAYRWEYTTKWVDHCPCYFYNEENVASHRAPNTTAFGSTPGSVVGFRRTPSTTREVPVPLTPGELRSLEIDTGTVLPR